MYHTEYPPVVNVEILKNVFCKLVEEPFPFPFLFVERVVK